MIKAVFFDIDDTIYDYTGADRIAQKALEDYALHKLGIPAGEFRQWAQRARRLADSRIGAGRAATHNRLIRFQCMLEMLGKPLFPHAYKMYSLYWDTLIGLAVPEPGIAELMEKLRARGTYVGFGTNMTADIQYRKIEKLGLGNMTDGIVTSEESGIEKPDKRLFLLCAEKAGAAPQECVFIGDSLTNDIEGAQGAGMYAVLYLPRRSQTIPDAPCPVIRDFGEYFEAEKLLTAEGK